MIFIQFDRLPYIRKFFVFVLKMNSNKTDTEPHELAPPSKFKEATFSKN